MIENPCRCVDCGGNEPTHSSDCTYMNETFGDHICRDDNSLYDATPDCDGLIVAASGGGVKCTKCRAWFCF